MYRQITLISIRQTLAMLGRRINERFPESGLAKISYELEQICSESDAKLQWISKPNYWLRSAIAAVIAAGGLLMVYSIVKLDFSSNQFKVSELVSISESLVNESILIGAALFFLFSLEAKYKRARAMASINELRALAHLIDMHQLTKDPTEIGQKSNTASSPNRSKSPYELNRYLDYCSELLSLIGKLAAIYAQRLPETQLVSAVNDIEELTNGFSRKVWQKINILQIQHGQSLQEDNSTPANVKEQEVNQS